MKKRHYLRKLPKGFQEKVPYRVWQRYLTLRRMGQISRREAMNIAWALEAIADG